MHKFLRSVGFSTYQKRKEIEKLLQKLTENAEDIKKLQIEQDTEIVRIRAEAAPGMGLVICGVMEEDGAFKAEYYYPYLSSSDISSTSDCSIQRHTEKETYAGLLDEYKVGISLIFYIDNTMEYQERKIKKEITEVSSACLTGLSVSGKILLPVQKTANQIEKAKVASKNRNNLLEAAKNGDEDAMETLTIEDIDLYSQISRRIMKEDIYSIIDSCFMPCGIECDQYSVIGEIKRIETKKNCFTEEEVYDLTLDCNDLIFHVGIRKDDLKGEPMVGRRFKGQIWMQGTVNFKEPADI
ncbi:DUF3881 domain-containing protein [Clostridium sp. chh4-2]|uniref:DUF3881 family protein n=1 Tax=Clostridium sp. chh4-2 TaxID=2067550 RepID=UPI000CCEB05B|nr:DUF3881 family protein [Clostridium sp. chh4-2]PNV61595.1 DUF3881 domain-containing protein [Clostridium sp. chh4-2]